MAIKMTQEQRDAIKLRFLLDKDGCESLDELEDKAVNMMSKDPCIMLPHRGIWLGIEEDGYTHS